MDDKELKKIANVLNAQAVKEKCLRHQIYKSKRWCRLCEAKHTAKGQVEYARKLYLTSDKTGWR